MKRILFFSIALAAAAACSSAIVSEQDASSPSASAQSGPRADTLSIRLGQSAVVDGGHLELKFDTRVADSRCPANVVCVWAGDAHIRLTTRVSGAAWTASDLHSTTPPTKLTVSRYTITMVGLTPYPGTGHDSDTPIVILRVSSE